MIDYCYMCKNECKRKPFKNAFDLGEYDCELNRTVGSGLYQEWLNPNRACKYQRLYYTADDDEE